MDVTIKDLVVEYRSAGYIVRPIDEFSVEMASGELVLLLGPSGCGKTTLLSALAGILSPTSGRIQAGDIDVTALSGRTMTAYRRSTVGVVFQSFNLVPSLSAAENVQAVLRLAGAGRVQARRRAAELIELVGLTERAHHRPGDLSGGEQQRVAIARAVAHDPPILLADEPTAHLDHVQVEGILKLLRELATPGRLVVVATHDHRLVPLADRVIDLSPKAPDEHGGPKRLTLSTGDVLFRQNDPSDRVYVVEEGRIEIVRTMADESETVLAAIGPGSYFGELGPIFGLQRSATARATVRTVVTGYSTHEFRSQVLTGPRTNGNGRTRATRAAAKGSSRTRS